MSMYIDDHVDLPQPEPNERSMTCIDCGANVSLDSFLEMAICWCELCYERCATFMDDEVC